MPKPLEVETVARALYEHETGFYWDTFLPHDKEEYFSSARVAIAALDALRAASPYPTGEPQP